MQLGHEPRSPSREHADEQNLSEPRAHQRNTERGQELMVREHTDNNAADAKQNQGRERPHPVTSPDDTSPAGFGETATRTDAVGAIRDWTWCRTPRAARCGDRAAPKAPGVTTAEPRTMTPPGGCRYRDGSRSVQIAPRPRLGRARASIFGFAAESEPVSLAWRDCHI